MLMALLRDLIISTEQQIPHRYLSENLGTSAAFELSSLNALHIDMESDTACADYTMSDRLRTIVQPWERVVITSTKEGATMLVSVLEHRNLFDVQM